MPTMLQPRCPTLKIQLVRQAYADPGSFKLTDSSYRLRVSFVNLIRRTHASPDHVTLINKQFVNKNDDGQS